MELQSRDADTREAVRDGRRDHGTRSGPWRTHRQTPVGARLAILSLAAVAFVLPLAPQPAIGNPGSVSLVRTDLAQGFSSSPPGVCAAVNASSPGYNAASELNATLPTGAGDTLLVASLVRTTGTPSYDQYEARISDSGSDTFVNLTAVTALVAGAPFHWFLNGTAQRIGTAGPVTVHMETTSPWNEYLWVLDICGTETALPGAIGAWTSDQYTTSGDWFNSSVTSSSLGIQVQIAGTLLANYGSAWTSSTPGGNLFADHLNGSYIVEDGEWERVGPGTTVDRTSSTSILGGEAGEQVSVVYPSSTAGAPENGTAIQAASLPCSSIIVSWTNGKVPSWLVLVNVTVFLRIGLSNDTAPVQVISTNGAVSSLQLNDLDCGTRYVFQVLDWYGGGLAGPLSGPFAFATAPSTVPLPPVCTNACESPATWLPWVAIPAVALIAVVLLVALSMRSRKERRGRRIG